MSDAETAPDAGTPPDGSHTPVTKATDTAGESGNATAGESGNATAAARPAPKRRRYKLLAAIAAVVVLALGIGAFAINSELRSIVHGFTRKDLMPGEQGRPSAPPPDGPVTILLAGTDSRDPATDPGNSDTLMMAYIPKNREHVYVISIPRDLWVKVHGRAGHAKINAAYAEGGTQLTILTLEDMFGVRLQHAAMINFYGFMQMIDNLGGIDIYNPYYTESVGNVYPEGSLHLGGDAALNYVRERKELTNGDLDRTGRQRAVLKAIVNKALAAGALNNPTVEKRFFSDMSGCVTLDAGFTDQTLTDLIWSMKIKTSEDVRSLMLPIAGYAASNDGQAIDTVDQQQVDDLAEAMAKDQMDAWWQSHRDIGLITGNTASTSSPRPTPGVTPKRGWSATASPTAGPAHQ